MQLVSTGLAGNHYDLLGGGGLTSYEATFTVGDLGLDSETAATDATTARTEVGLNAELAWGVQARTYVAWRTSGGVPQSDSKDRVPRVWFQISKSF